MPSSADERIARLEDLFASLPGLGPRSAARLVTELLGTRKSTAQAICRTLADALECVHHCPQCHTLTTQPVCDLCADRTRDASVVCVVETPADQKAVESTVAYRGGYFVLMGRVNPLEGVTPQELGVDKLVERIERENVREVVLATSYTAEGETTAHVLAGVLKKRFPELRVTRLARGLPSGVEIEYTDVATLSRAITGRR